MLRTTCRPISILMLIAFFVAGCGGTDLSPTRNLDLTQLLSILPTPAGVTLESSSVTKADAARVQEVFARQAKADSAEVVAGSGLEAAAIRTWSGPDGAEFVVVSTRWPDHQRATNWGAGAAELPLGSPGASAWTPRELPGARGSRVDPPGERSRALSLAVADISIFVRADGPVDDAALIRTLDLALRPVRAAVDGG